MSHKLIECVPNFSEGRNTDVIKQITDTIESVEGTRLLDVDPGAEMNRTVVTFVGTPESVKEAAFLAIKKASELIDMSKHSGSHPRMGATDVCPFIPVSGVTEQECIEYSKEVAKRVGEELNIPVYLYEKSAQIPERQNLAVVRKGEYEALPEKLKDPKWKPDFGPAKFNAKAGATVIGVREFLIAYNINLNTREKLHATDIAFELREKGRSARRGNIKPFYYKGTEILKYEEGRYPCGECDFDGKSMQETIDHCKKVHNYDLIELLKLNDINPDKPEGESVKKKGMFSNCKAIGWLVPEYDRAQISINLTNYNITSMHHVLEATRQLAAERGLVVTGSEIVGLVPYPALLQTGKYYLKQQQRSTGVPVKDILRTAVQSLGLTDVSDFNIEERVLGLPQNSKDALVEMKVTDFIDEVSRESPAPGGGSIAALSGALGAALSSMVSNLTANNRGSEKVDDILNDAADKCQKILSKLRFAIDEDTNAFNAYMDARRLPNKTKEEKNARFEAMQNGLKQAVMVPLETAKLSFEAIKIAQIVAKNGNPNSITDVGVGAQSAFTGVLGGIYNVLINLRDIKDESFVKEMRAACAELKEDAQSELAKVLDYVEAKL
ncbi:MAG: glutamate formimidoyltransferase [Melioribacteraceae bacterium]|nr:glutamate formimidoyltransferase [Melioribacteraceae bacterium]MCO6473077.1 glutamate formimidoyltransferase [Melioribacteraceae bacterium]MDD3558016.1 glutamate formimidoyltransferase [Melioribacteraceae bacterium]